MTKESMINTVKSHLGDILIIQLTAKSRVISLGMWITKKWLPRVKMFENEKIITPFCAKIGKLVLTGLTLYRLTTGKLLFSIFVLDWKIHVPPFDSIPQDLFKEMMFVLWLYTCIGQCHVTNVQVNHWELVCAISVVV